METLEFEYRCDIIYNENWAHARSLHVLKQFMNQIIMEEIENTPLWLL